MNSTDDEISVISLVDDVDRAADVAATFEESPRFSAEATTSPAEMLEALDESDADCVVCSYDLGGADGRRSVRRLRLTWPLLPIVLYGDVNPREISNDMMVETDGFVPEDDDRTALLERVAEVVDESDDAVQRSMRDDYVEFDSAAIHKSVLLDAIFDRLPVHTFVKDEQARHVLVSRAFTNDLESMLGLRDIDIDHIPIEQAEETYADDLEVIRNERPIIDKEEQVPGIDQWNLTSKVPLYDETGDCIGLLGITRDITERKLNQREVRRQNERLEQFASVVSHDLRNPLGIAKGHLEMAREECESDHLDEIEWALDRMDDIVDEVLELARQGQTVVETEDVSLAAVGREARRAIDAEGLTVEIEDDLDPIEADEDRLRRLVENLLRNSVEHAGPDVRVTVSSLEDGDGFAVEDDGPGIPPKHRETIFDPGESRSSEGTGFGLAIVREIAEAHDWSIAATEGADGGARFEIRGVERAAPAEGSVSGQ